MRIDKELPTRFELIRDEIVDSAIAMNAAWARGDGSERSGRRRLVAAVNTYVTWLVEQRLAQLNRLVGGA